MTPRSSTRALASRLVMGREGDGGGEGGEGKQGALQAFSLSNKTKARGNGHFLFSLTGFRSLPPPPRASKDCSATVTRVAAGASRFSYEQQAVAATSWSYFAFNVSADARGLSVALVRQPTADSDCTPQLYLERGSPPGNFYGQYDARPAYHYYTVDVQSQEVSLEYGDGIFRPGLWYAGVRGGDVGCAFSVMGAIYRCPRDCSGHGACVDSASGNGSRTCACDGSALGRDCSQLISQAAFDAPFTWDASPASPASTYVVLPPLTPSFIEHRADVSVEAAFTSPAWQANAWITARPTLYLQSGADLPSSANFAFKLVLDRPQATFQLLLGASQLAPSAGPGGGTSPPPPVWRAALFNPLSGYALQMNLTLHKVRKRPYSIYIYIHVHEGGHELNAHNACPLRGAAP